MLDDLTCTPVQEHWLWKSLGKENERRGPGQKGEGRCSLRLFTLIEQARARHSQILSREGCVDVCLVVNKIRSDVWSLHNRLPEPPKMLCFCRGGGIIGLR